MIKESPIVLFEEPSKYMYIKVTAIAYTELKDYVTPMDAAMGRDNGPKYVAPKNQKNLRYHTRWR